MPKPKPKSAAKSPKAKPSAAPPVKKVLAKAPAKPAPAPTKAAIKKSAPEPKKSIVSKKTEKPSAPLPKAEPPKGPVKMTDFLRKQRERLLALRDSMLDSMHGMAQDNLRTRAEGSEASAFGMHQGDAGSDAYDRDFALSMLSQEQDALYEIDEALKRIEGGTYGVCEMSNKAILPLRLEAIPFTRYTVECQAQLEKQSKYSRVRQTVTSLFGLNEDEGGDGDEEESTTTPSDSRERE